MQIRPIALIFGLALSLLSLVGCEPGEELSEGPNAFTDVCEGHADCPSSQICSEGSCVATCLNAALCASSGSISGTLQIETSATVGELDRWQSARAGFIPTEYLEEPQWIVFPGTDCVAIPNEVLTIPCGLSVGDIHFQTTSLENGEIETVNASSDGDAFLEANQTTEGIHYSARQLEEMHFHDAMPVLASSSGGDLPGFAISMQNPAPLLNVQVTSGKKIVAGEDFVVEWTPGFDAQVLVKIEGMATPMEDTIPTTIICPARDEAGVIVVPAKATSLLNSEEATVRVVRRNISLIPYAGTHLPATISQTLSWKEEVDTGRTPSR